MFSKKGETSKLVNFVSEKNEVEIRKKDEIMRSREHDRSYSSSSKLART